MCYIKKIKWDKVLYITPVESAKKDKLQDVWNEGYGYGPGGSGAGNKEFQKIFARRGS